MTSTNRIVPHQASDSIRRRLSGRPIDRGQAVLLALLVILTAGAWALTVQQARTMDMPMGVVARGGADAGGAMPADPPAGTDAADAGSGEMDDMAGMEGMSGMDEMSGPASETSTGDGAGMAAAAGMAGMTGMGNGGWTWDGFATFFVAWAVMMAAMMLPAAAPMLLLFRTVSAGRPARGQAAVSTWIFASGYLLVWAGIGAATWAAVQGVSELAGRLGAADRDTWGPLALGTVLLIAGLYQLTPLKRVCLDHCRTPIGFVLHHWRDGRLGALRMGLIHGVVCLGCCWALFAVLVAAGVMSLAWMLLLTLVVFAEKVLPLGRWAPRTVGAAFLVLGVIVGAGALDMPWMH